MSADNSDSQNTTTNPDTQTPLVYPTVQCENKACYRWNDNPKPGEKCVKCREVLPIWVGYLDENKYNGPYIPPLPLERADYQETWNTNETPNPLERSYTGCNDEPNICGPLQLKRTDGNDEHLTNEERVFQEIMMIYGVDREGAMKQLDRMVKTAVVKHL